MQQFVVFVRLIICCVVLFGPNSFCYATDKVEESSNTRENKKSVKPKLAIDLAKSAIVPSAADKPVVTTHSITIGDSELA